MRYRRHPATEHRRSRPWRRLSAAIAAGALATSLVVMPAAGLAQDGTGGAGPRQETGCVLAPASNIASLLAGSNDISTLPEATSPASPAATPVASPAATPMASPVAAAATPVASPVASLAASIDDALLRSDLSAAVTSVVSCLNEGKAATAARWTSDTFRGQLIGSAAPVSEGTFTTLFQTLPPISYRVRQVRNVQLRDGTTATANIAWQMAHQVRTDQWTFALKTVQGVPVWTVDRIEPATMSSSITAHTVEVIIADNRYTLAPDTVRDATIRFDVSNTDTTDHELLVLQLKDGVSTDALLTTPGPQLPDGVAWIGQATIGAGSDGQLLLAGLAPGTYTIVCLLPDDEGLPHLADGMKTTFTVKPGNGQG